MPIPRLAFFALLACATSLLAQSRPVSTPATTNPTVAYVYVGKSTLTSLNGKIYAYSVLQDGSVHAVAGSPFSGPAGMGLAGGIVASPARIFGTDGTHIATYTRSANGALHLNSKINGTAHNDTPAPDSASFAMTLDRTNASLYAAEINFQGSDNNAYAEFGVGSTGALSFKANSAIDVNYTDQLELSGNNTFAYGQGCFFGSWEVFGFARAKNGSLSSFDPGFQFPTSSDPDFQICPVSMSASGHGYLADAFLSTAPNTVEKIAIYQILGSGKLSWLPNSTLAVPFTDGKVRFDPSGKYLAVAGTGGIAVYQFNASHKLVKLGSTLDKSVAFLDTRWDNHGHLYAISSKALYVFTVSGGKFTATGSAHSIATSGLLDLAVLALK